MAALVAMNDANWVSFGGAGSFAPHKTVHMLGEDINITIFDERIHVRVYFSFENRGPATTVKMAFPFETVAWNKNLVRSFSSKVDGEPAKLEVLKDVPLTLGDKDMFEQQWARNEVYVKSVDFAAGQRRTVLVDYTTARGHAGSGFLFDQYILETGATWAGRIGTITITVDWARTSKVSRPSLTFYGEGGREVAAVWTEIGRRRRTTELKDVEPDFNLSLTSILGFWNVNLNGSPLDPSFGIANSTGPILSGDPSDPYFYEFGFADFFTPSGPLDFEYYTGEVANTFGNHLELIDKHTLRNGLGKNLKLKRPAVAYGDYEARIRLKDLIEALGGTFTWVEADERIDLTLPTRAKPLRKKGDPIPPPNP